ncbi:MAG: arylsulfatase [Phycisphaerales bacterium]|nr:arylsulfatase [Phycisphaerales bacterium]
MNRPNILLILNDDMGYSDLGCYGGEIDTPHLDRLARGGGGLRFTNFSNTPRCTPSRASLLTGLHPHQCGIGILTDHFGDGDYDGNLSPNCITIPELLNPLGYRCYLSGKWHLTNVSANTVPNGTWPLQRGFHHHYGIISGGSSYYWPGTLVRDFQNIEHEAQNNPDYYFTDAISDEAVNFLIRHHADHPDQPFFHYLAYTAPHWPLHAREADIAQYKGRFDEGWDVLRDKRRDRMIEMGLIDPQWQLTARDPAVPAWDTLTAERKRWEARRMEVYAAQITVMDRGIGRILQTLEAQGQLDNTLILFMSDNGGCSEELGHLPRFPNGRPKTRDGRDVLPTNNPAVDPGPENTYQTYGVNWANVSNTPFRMYKHWTHEGGIATPFIVHLPQSQRKSEPRPLGSDHVITQQQSQSLPYGCGSDCHTQSPCIGGNAGIRHQHAYLPDIFATITDLTNAPYPNHLPPCEGTSLLPAFANQDLPDRMMFWEHEGNAAVRHQHWKLVKNFTASPTGKRFYGDERGDWELYTTTTDRTEMHNIASHHPALVATMSAAWETWANRVGVIPREQWLTAARKAGAD